jgi:hypothetical protein
VPALIIDLDGTLAAAVSSPAPPGASSSLDELGI